MVVVHKLASTRFFCVVGKRKKTGDTESKGKGLRASFFYAPFDLNDFESFCLL